MADSRIISEAERYGTRATAFGDAAVVELNPVIGIKASYGITDDHRTFSATGGSATASNSEFICQSGTSVGGYGTIWSRRPMVYFPGVGAECRITARFTTGIPNSTQLAGMFTSADGMMFGYDGAQFGVMHRHGGQLEIRTLTITNPAGGAETVTVTLNGTAYETTVTAGTEIQNAHEIETDLIASAANAAWYIQHIGDTVVFAFRGVGSKAGTYSVSSTGTLTGTFSQQSAGADATEDWTYMGSWNKYNPDWLDPTKGNLYKMTFAYLGYGPLQYFVMDPDRKEWRKVHEVNWPNKNTATNFGQPSMRVGWAAASLGSSGTNLTVAGGSGALMLQGNRGPERGLYTAVGNNASISTETQILSVKVRTTYADRFCNAIVFPLVTMATDSTKGMIFRVYLNADVAGVTDHQYVDEANSVCIYDTAGTTVSGGRLIGAYVVGPSGTASVNLGDLGKVLIAGDELTVTGQVTSGAAAGGFVTINTSELI